MARLSTHPCRSKSWSPGRKYRVSGTSRFNSNPTRVSESPGFNPPGFRVYDHVESQNKDHSVFAGQPRGSPPGTCGIYDSDVLGGNIRHVMEISGCNQWVVGGKFSLSPDGEQL